MFLIVKDDNEKIFVALEGSDSVLASMYASLKEEYKEIDLEIVFSRPICKIERNIVRFVDLLKGNGKDKKVEVKRESRVETIVMNETRSNKANNVNIDRKENIGENTLVLEEAPKKRRSIQLDVEEVKPISKREEIQIEEVEVKPIATEKESIEIEEVEPVVVRRVDPAERALERIREQQRQEGLPKLENKVNTLEYRKYLENFMKLGFTASVLSKKVADINDRELKGKMNELCNVVMARVENYEEKFREAGLTTAQIHTFRMEALREVKKYRDSAYEEVYKYLRKLYELSEDLIKEL